MLLRVLGRITFLGIMLCVCLSAFCAEGVSSLSGKNVLVYTKNGVGFAHDNLKEAADAIVKLGKLYDFKVDVSDDPNDFSEGNLSNYHIIVFANTNNEVFTSPAQRLALRRFVEAGGGVVGIHSAIGTERNWSWFNQLIGGTFVWHPKKQPLLLTKIKQHESTLDIPTAWNWVDECYFSKTYYPGIEVLVVANLDSLDQADQESIAKNKTSYGNLHPVVWSQKFDGGTVWVTTLGHDKEAFVEPVFVKHITGGLAFVASQTQKLDYSKAYATSFDEAVRY